MMPAVSCAVLAGGESRRMGRDKAGVLLAGKPLIERVLTTVTPLFDEVLICGGDKERSYPHSRFVADALPGRGPAVGLHAAMLAARHPYVFAVACDMPFIAPSVIAMLVGRRLGAHVVVPVVDGRMQPLCAVYRTDCADLLARRLNNGERGLISFIEQTKELKVRLLDEHELRAADPQLRSFVDIDSAAMLTAAEGLLA